jgi:hypothetical protein
MRWSFARRTTIEPFVDIAAGVMLTNQQVPRADYEVPTSLHTPEAALAFGSPLDVE